MNTVRIYPNRVFYAKSRSIYHMLCVAKKGITSDELRENLFAFLSHFLLTSRWAVRIIKFIEVGKCGIKWYKIP